jgi:hypothetical protein
MIHEQRVSWCRRDRCGDFSHQLNPARWLFLAARGEVGGFGVGSQITWNTQAMIGVNFTRNGFAELGYR